jgi:hypothetical protein
MVSGYNRVSLQSSGQKREMHRMETPLKFKTADVTRSPQWAQSLQGLKGVSNYANDLMDPSGQAYQNFSAPAMTDFQQQIVPGIAERFGGEGALSSSGFNQTMGAAGSDLAQRLAALRSGLQMQGASLQQQLSSQLAGMAQQPVQNQFELAGLNQNRQNMLLSQTPYSYLEKPASSRSQLGSGIMGGLGSGIGSKLGSGLMSGLGGAATGFMTGGPMGALAGAGGGLLKGFMG